MSNDNIALERIKSLVADAKAKLIEAKVLANEAGIYFNTDIIDNVVEWEDEWEASDMYC